MIIFLVQVSLECIAVLTSVSVADAVTIRWLRHPRRGGPEDLQLGALPASDARLNAESHDCRQENRG